MTEIRRIVSVLLLTAALAAAGCGGGGESETAGSGSAGGSASKSAGKGKSGAAKAAKPAGPSAPTKKTETLTDPVEDAFTVKAPKGWNTIAYSAGGLEVHREVVNSVSPDGHTVLFLGDPKIPQYYNPETADEMLVSFAEKLDYMELQSYIPADEYFPQWTQDKFGDLPGFEITGSEVNQKTLDSIARQWVAAGLEAPTAHATSVYFAYEQDGKPMKGLVIGYTIDSGSFWQADVTGLSTDREVEDYLPMLQRMAKSKKTKDSFLARWNAQHEAIMADIQAGTDAMTQQHNANMAAIQGSAQRHQARMDAIHAAGDANTAAFENRMSAMDDNQRTFLNYVNDEETVVDGGGKQFQVDDGYDRYWVKKSDNSYVGGDINFDDQKLLELGLNPSDYEEVKKKR